jgi:uncharacterized SAM-binding protein YcdF (DUF218 family)
MSPLFIKSFLGSFLLPPGNGLLLLLVALVFRRRRWALAVAALGGFLLLVQSLPVTSGWLRSTLEARAGKVVTEAGGAQAIVVLGGGLNRRALEYGGESVHERTLVRLRYGAHLARLFDLPVLVSGGLPPRAQTSEAAAMATVMEKEFGIGVRWREDESRDTAENAEFSARMLRAAGIRRVLLVTQAYHMPRARRLFAQAGLEVVPAPTEIPRERDEAPALLDFLPSASALLQSYYALHEWQGIAWAELVRFVKPALLK